MRTVYHSLRGWDFLTHGRAVREVAGSNPGRGTIVGGVFHPIRQLTRFSRPICHQFKIVNLYRINRRGEGVN